MAGHLPVSPLAPKGGFPDLPAVPGVRFATIAAGVKYQNRADVMLAELSPGTVIAGTFTRSRTRAAPVLDCQEKLGGSSEEGAAIVVNSGNANAFTGIAGVTAVKAITAEVSALLDIPEGRVFTASTGVIGEPLPHQKVIATLTSLQTALAPDGLADAARAIMTTDTFPKGASRQVQIEGKTVTISGIAKGSGMIAPDMATMLVYIFTDAKIGFKALQALVSTNCDTTFNCITVDSDTSTSDSLLVAATGQSGIAVSTEKNAPFATALNTVMDDLAKQVVRDGEGATKFITVQVEGAASNEDARLVAFSIANSPLVKTAIAGEDPNWGRVVMAVGKSGAEADRDRLTIRFGDVLVAKNGQMHPDYVEADAAVHMKSQEVTISVDLGLNRGQATVYTCDLTAQYIAINADYRS
ncbi:bifunctional glutamate N-acetyltransferase/amino-acid acetyltransferase ArgJ [Rhodobacteraceae bacterium]|nr:bifunctional glutamate N-acetyltransferase/amino-acid acetyltransferase ArgJ [Paracoccaceae bacterium]